MTSRSATDPPARAPSRRDLLVDGAIALAVFAASLGLLAVGESGAGGVQAAAVLFTALASLPLAARRVAPLPVFVATALASSALYLVAEPAGPPIGPTLALYWLAVAGEGSRTATPVTLAVVGAMLAAHVTASGVGRDAFPGTEILFGLLVWGGAWLAGDRARLRRERMAELEQRALQAERDADRERRLAAAEERGRIARDLHDSAGHAINVILVHAGMGRLQSGADPEIAREAFETIEDVARETVGEIDQMVRVLRQDVSPLGDEVEPPPGLAALDGLVARHRATGLRIETGFRGDRTPLPPGADRAAYRILQEALTNAARHGDGSVRVEVDLGPSSLEITVANPLPRERTGPGAGDGRADGGGHGVVGMRERAALLGGSLDAGVRGELFVVRARLPYAGGRA